MKRYMKEDEPLVLEKEIRFSKLEAAERSTQMQHSSMVPNNMHTTLASAMDKKVKKKRVNSSSRATTQMGDKR
jgi:hypothetical protein